MEVSDILKQISTQLPPHFINHYEMLMAMIGIKPSTQSSTKPGTAERFMEIYTAAAATQSLPSPISCTHGILEGLGWTESSLHSLRDLIRGDPQLPREIVQELGRLNCQPMEAAIVILLDKIAYQLGRFQCSQYYLAVCVLMRSRHLTDHTFMEQFDAVKKSFARHSLAVALTCSVLERAGWGDTVELRKYAASDFHLEKQYPLIDLCLTVAAFFNNMSDTDYRNAKLNISIAHLNSQAVDRIDRTEFVLLLKDRNIISPGNVSRIEDKERYPVFFKDYKDNYRNIFPPASSPAIHIVTPIEQTETKCSAEIHEYEKILVKMQDNPSSTPATVTPGPRRRQNLMKLQKNWGDTSTFMSTMNLAKQLVQEANFLSEALHLNALFKVALTIPKSILSSCEYQCSELLTSDEIVIRVICKQRGIDSIWPLNTFIEKVQMMQNMCEFSERQRPDNSSVRDLFITEEKETLLGVANMYLKCLYYGIAVVHKAPIIGPAGKDIGALMVKVALKPMKYIPSSIEVNELKLGTHIKVEISVIQASHLPAAYTHNLYCQYRFWRQECDIIVKSLTDAKPAHHLNEVHQFQNEQVFKVEVTKDFLEYIQKEALAIEVWGHKKKVPLDKITEAEYAALSQIWNDVTQYIELWVDIREVNSHGEYVSVGTQVREDVKCGRIFQLHQNQFRRIHVRVVQVPNSGNGPLICDSISSVLIGNMYKINKKESRKDAPIDSYQEEDLERLQTRINDQKKHLVLFTRELMKQGEVDAVTDKKLKYQWNKYLGFYTPGIGPGVPKAPTYLQHGLEERVPVIFLDLSNVDDDKKTITRLYSWKLSGESAEDMVELPVKTVKRVSKDKLKAVAHWDPGAYKADCLNTVTADGFRIYAILQVGVKLQNPPNVEIQLKKRICMKVNSAGRSGEVTKDNSCGVMFRLVTDIPSMMIEQPSPHCLLIDLEENENAIGKINAGIRTIANTLELDRLQQEYCFKKRFHELQRHIPYDEFNTLLEIHTFVSDDAKHSDITSSLKTTHLTSQTKTAGDTTPTEATIIPLNKGQAITSTDMSLGTASAACITTATDIPHVSKGEKVMVDETIIALQTSTGGIKFTGRTQIGLELTQPDHKDSAIEDMNTQATGSQTTSEGLARFINSLESMDQKGRDLAISTYILKDKFSSLGIHCLTSKSFNDAKMLVRQALSDACACKPDVIEKYRNDLDNATDAKELFTYLCDYNFVTYLNYQLLEKVSSLLDDRKIRQEFDAYKEEYTELLKCASFNGIISVFKSVPSLMPAAIIGFPILKLYLQKPELYNSLYDLFEFLKLPESQFVTCSIDKNCIVITFSIFPSVLYDLLTYLKDPVNIIRFQDEVYVTLELHNANISETCKVLTSQITGHSGASSVTEIHWIYNVDMGLRSASCQKEATEVGGINVENEDGSSTSTTDGSTQRKNIRNIGEESEGDAMKTFKAVLDETIGELSDSENLQLLVVGKTGEGKSTLINSIVELKEVIAKEGAHGSRCTDDVQQYLYQDVIPGINVTVIDSPGLQDIHHEQPYIDVMKSLCEEVNLVLYCMKMINHRLKNEDKLAMQKLHQAFGPKFWERVVFVLTFANKEDCEQRDDRDKDEQSEEPHLEDKAKWKELTKRRFIDRVELRAKEVKKFLAENISADMNVEKIHFLPAGCYKVTPRCPYPLHLPDEENWLYKLLNLCCYQIRSAHLFKKLSLRDNIHLAIIIDNDRKATTDANGQIITLNGQAKEMKEALEKLGFCVLYFSGISFESFAHLMEALQNVDHSELASFALVILSKGKTHHVYDVNKEQISFNEFLVFDERNLSKVPKMFFFHLSHSKTPNDDLAFNANLPANSIALIVSRKRLNRRLNSPVIDAFVRLLKSSKPLRKFFQELQDTIESDTFATSKPVIDRLTDDYVLPTPYEPSTPRKRKSYLKKQLHLYRTLWHPVRCNTVDVLLSTKEKVAEVVRNERIAKIATYSTSLVAGGSLAVAGIALAPFTFGGSLAISVLGGVVGTALGAGGITAFITSKIMSNNKLKRAQQQVHLDQQLSQSLNGVAAKYSESLKSCASEVASEVAGGLRTGAATLGRGVAAAVSASVVETSTLALRTAGRVAGMTLAGATLAVTVPIDIGMIAYNSYMIHKSNEDKSGKSDKNKIIQWIVKETEEMLKGTFITVGVTKREIKGSQAFEFDDPDNECGYKVLVSANKLAGNEKSTLAVSTILSGPFVLPEGATLVSAVYDVQIEEKLRAPVTIEIEHCVDITDQSTAEKMTFATATVDFKRKVFVFTPVEGGTFPQGQTHIRGLISLKKSSLLCILHYSELVQDQLKIKYAAQCSATKECKNFWKMDIKFTKSLVAHYKYIQMEAIPDPVSSCTSFKFMKPNTGAELPCIKLEEMEHCIRERGWMISHHVPPRDVNQQVLNMAELHDFSKPQSSELFPSLTLDIQVEDEERASDKLETSIEVKCTDLRLSIAREKDPNLRRTKKQSKKKDEGIAATMSQMKKKYVTVPTKKLKVHYLKFAVELLTLIDKYFNITIIIIITVFILVVMSYIV